MSFVFAKQHDQRHFDQFQVKDDAVRAFGETNAKDLWPIR